MILGFDIGGTKCAVIIAELKDGNIDIVERIKVPTDLTVTPECMIKKLVDISKERVNSQDVSSVGISCGGPLNSKTGVIMSPPNLTGWDNVPIVEIVKREFPVPVHLQNDANACAVAEWKFGAGKGSKNMVFLTFGTGLGAGLILDGKLYIGTNDNAGEVGHIRLDKFGPVGFGKAGSFEGFCSGGGIAQLGYMMALEKVQAGEYPLYFKQGYTAKDVTAKTIADAANAGDETAIEVYRTCGEYLGRGLSVLIDILNPEVIVIGSIFARSQNLLWDSARKIIKTEALNISAKCCKVVPAALGEQIGDYAAIGVALLED